MKTLLFIFITFVFHLKTDGQNFSDFEPDDDTLSGIVVLDCSTKYGRHLFDSENMNFDDSLKCLQVQHIPLENSNKVLCIERNFFGDTLGVGLKKEIIVKEKQSLFYTRNEDRLNSTYTSYDEKIGEWFYYYPDGKLKEKIDY